MDHWVQFVVSIIGSGLGTTGVALLFKRKFDRELETHKAFLTRAANVHGRMIDTLANLNRHLYEAQGFFQRMTSAGRFKSEISPEAYDELLAKAMQSAYNELLQGRLFIPPALVQECDSFFDTVLKGRLKFSIAQDPMMDPLKRAEFWQAAATVAHQQVPKILQQIEEAARTVIHGEPPDRKT